MVKDRALTLVILLIWIFGIFGFSVPPEFWYPSVCALGSSDSVGAWRCQVPTESEDLGVQSMHWDSFMRVVWSFRFSG
jgi:hypothetical protein